MNSQKRLENLIYLSLTFVQLLFLGNMGMASPSMEPTIDNSNKENTLNPINDTSSIESLSVSNLDENEKLKSPSNNFDFARLKPLGLTIESYMGPLNEETQKSAYFLGLDYSIFKYSNSISRLGFLMGAGSSALFYLNQEYRSSSFWRYWKSYSLIGQIEMDSSLGISSIFSINQGMAGMGINFYLINSFELSINLLPISLRGSTIEVRLAAYLF